MAQRMGLTDRVFHLPEGELLRELFRGTSGAIGDIDPATIMTAGPGKLAPGDAQEFATPSGKMEIYSGTLGATGVNPKPDLQADPPGEVHPGSWPLRLLS